MYRFQNGLIGGGMRMKELKFVPMSQEMYEAFYDYSTKDYAKDLETSGKATKEDSLSRAKEEFSQLLPQGMDTKDNYIVSVVLGEEVIGSLWYQKLNEKTLFICDILIYEEFRGKGYGKLTLQELDKVTRELGLGQILLHVFSYNERAIRLYEKHGYVTASEEKQGSFYMKKVLV